jgi:O-antigen/teichoic acid export membrane protein
MNQSRTKNSLLIMLTGFFANIITLILTFITRTVFIHTLGVDYLGLKGLFTSILVILSLADLGIGAAISYYLYKPVANGDIEKVKSYAEFLKKSYRIIGLIVFIIGITLLPLLDKVINFDVQLEINIYHVYLLFLLNSVISYLFFAYRLTILDVFQKRYLSNIINLTFQIINSCATIVILLVLRNYILTLIISNIILIIQNLVVSIYSIKVFPFLKDKSVLPLDKSEKKELSTNIRAIFLLKLSAILFNSSDNIVISSLIGTVYTGLNSNYLLIINTVIAFSAIIEGSFIAGVGNLNAISNKTTMLIYFNRFDFINFWVKSIITVCLFQLLNPFITLWIGKEFIFPNIVVFLIALNFISQQLLVTLYTFRETLGLFNYGKYLQLIAGILNIFFSIFLGLRFGIFGIFLATAVTWVFIYAINFIRVVFRYGFNISPGIYIMKYFFYILITVFNGFLVFLISSIFKDLNWLTFIYQLIISLLLPNIILFMIYKKSEEFKYAKNKIFEILNSMILKLRKSKKI